MKVGLHDADKTNFPNLALMKLSAAYKAAGHTAEFYNKAVAYDKVVSSKVFLFTDVEPLPDGAVLGGSGYKSQRELPDHVEHICPDYSLYGLDYSVGFTTRGCTRSCSHCIVPAKEGSLRAHADVDEFLRHDRVVLMDNNPLGCDHGVDQIDKLGRLGVRVDYNQGLDARYIDDTIARRLGKLKWLKPLRLACDSQSQKEPVHKAVELLRWHNCAPMKYFCYVLVEDVEEALDRVKFLKGLYLDPFCQPYRPIDGGEPTRLQRRFARWVNTPQAFKTMTWEQYQEWRGDRI